MATKGNKDLLQINTGTSDFSGACIVIVRTEWNSEILDELERGCTKVLSEYAIRNIKSITVPGAVEIPFGIKNYWDANKYRDNRPTAFIALACIIRGGTPHFEYVCKAVTEGVVQLNLLLPVPTIFGVLTVENLQQAKDRIGGEHGHKGEEAALTALKMISISKSFRQP
jgi:6,7-dimethyl-8-ribityllumazine synthase